LPITSAIRDGLLPVATLWAASVVLAASSARMFSAAARRSQRHHADPSGGRQRDRAAGKAVLPNIHRGSFLVPNESAQMIVAPTPIRF